MRPGTVYPQRIVITWLRHIWVGQLRSLRGRLRISLACLLLMLLALEGAQYMERMRSRVEMLRRLHLYVAQSAAEATSGETDAVFRQEEAIAGVVFHPAFGEDALRSYVDSVLAQRPDLLSVIIVDDRGYARYLAPGRPLTSVTTEPFFLYLHAHSEASRWVSGVLQEQGQGAFVRFASKYQDGTGNVRGYVVLDYRLQSGGEDWLPVSDRPNHVDALLDAKGNVISIDGDEQLQAFLRSNRVLHTLARVGAVPEVRHPGKESLSGYVVSVPGIGPEAWYLVHLRDDQYALTELSQRAGTAFVALVLIVLVFALASILLIRLGLRPLRRLTIVSERLGAGDLTLRMPRAELEDFEPLVESFNRMAERLEAAQRDLTEANHALERRVQERTHQLEEQQDRLLRAERLSTLGLFSSAIAHELRNPLNTISLSLFWIKSRLGDSPEPRMNARLETMEREVRRSERIIQTLLAFARTGEPSTTNVELAPLVQEVLDVVRPPEAVTVEVRMAPHLPPLCVDRAQVFQVLDNLIRNAVQAMTQRGRLRITAIQSGKWCDLSISDSGPGIPPELRESIFEPLVTTKATGTGLGLALCKRIVDAHGGEIHVQSTPGEGATFYIRLPLAE